MCAEPVPAQPRYAEPTYDQSAPAQYSQPEKYGQSVPEQYDEPAPVVQSTAPRHTPTNATDASQYSTAAYHQPGPGQNSTAKQTVYTASKAEPASSPFDVDAWLAEINIGSAPQKQATTSTAGQFDANGVSSGSQQAYDGAQHASQCGVPVVGSRSSNSPENGSSKPRYTPPHMRSESGPPLNDAPSTSQQAPLRKPPPGFAGRQP